MRVVPLNSMWLLLCVLVCAFAESWAVSHNWAVSFWCHCRCTSNVCMCLVYVLRLLLHTLVPISLLAKIIGLLTQCLYLEASPRKPFFSMHTEQILLDLPCYTNFLSLPAGECLCLQFHIQNVFQEIPCRFCFLIATKGMSWRMTVHQTSNV